MTLDLFFWEALTISLIAERPDAWKKEPYYSSIKGWARRFCPENNKILVIDQRGSVTAVLPDRDLPVGVVRANEEVVIYREGGNYGAAVRPRFNPTCAKCGVRSRQINALAEKLALHFWQWQSGAACESR